jgi:hypothetical protein
LNRPAAAGPWPAAAPHRQQERRRRAHPPRPRPVRGPAGRSVHRTGRTGASRLPSARQPGQEAVGPGPDQPGNRSRPPGRPGPVQSRDRGRALHQPQGGRIPPRQHLRQVRPARTPAAAPRGRAMARAHRRVIAACLAAQRKIPLKREGVGSLPYLTGISLHRDGDDSEGGAGIMPGGCGCPRFRWDSLG